MNNLQKGVTDSVTPFAIPSLSESFTHCGAGVCFCYGIEVAVDVGSGAHIAMSEPFLDLLHGHALCKEHRGAEVAQIVEENPLQVVLLKLA